MECGNLWSQGACNDTVKYGMPLGHFGMAEVIANMAIYLASPSREHITVATRVTNDSE
jgi:hypothetical protein